jgi:hypothetical protein
MFFKCARIVGLLIVVVIVRPSGFAQHAGAPTAKPPRILIEIPDNIPSDSLWIRYALRGQGGNGGLVKQIPSLRSYAIEAMVGAKPAQHARVVVYAAGCQFKAYALDLNGTSDVSEHFKCDPLPTRTLHGFLPPSEIPPKNFPSENEFAVAGSLSPDWVCDFFLQGVGGSCLGSSIPLGLVGDLDLSNNGAFEITIPDFAQDPLFRGSSTVSRSGNFGESCLACSTRKSATAGGVSNRRTLD